ncbi:MAG: hypothetical protein HYR49_07175 [Gammaproteobacteria bacterium]|nr:hypothetical protein [Gammaproteobacteria bacterium]
MIAGLLAATYFVWTAAFMQPMEKQQRELKLSQERVAAEIAGLNAQAQTILKQAQQDPNVIHRAELESLKKELAQLNEKLAGTTDHLVTPGQMPRVLETVLQEAGGLQLQQVVSLGSSPLVPEKTPAGKSAEAGDADDGGEVAARKVYKHGVKLVLQGSFFSVLEFLRKLERLDWKFFWDAIDFRVVDYPDATVEITVFTISLEPTWIGS